MRKNNRLFDARSRLQDFTAPPCYPNEARAEARKLREQLNPGAKMLVVHADTGQTFEDLTEARQDISNDEVA